MRLCLTKLSVILEIDPYHSIFFNERIIAAISNFQGMSSKNDSLLLIKEIVRIYANSKYLDRNVRCLLFILAEYSLPGQSQVFLCHQNYICLVL